MATMDVGHEVRGGSGGHRRRFFVVLGHTGTSSRPTRPQGLTGALVTPGSATPIDHVPKPHPVFAPPPAGGDLFDWLRVLYPRWAMLAWEAVYLSAIRGS